MNIFLGFCSHGTVDVRFMMNVIRLTGSGKLPIKDFHVAINPYIPSGRCSLFENFLASDCDWLLSLDHDIIVSEEDIQKMMLYCDRYNVISGLYVNGHNIGDKIIDLPLFYQTVGDKLFCQIEAISESGATEISAAGFGLLLIHRSLVEDMKEKFKDDPWPWTGHDIHNGARLGEDLTFFLRARECNLRAVGVFGARAKHIKTRFATVKDIGRIHA